MSEQPSTSRFLVLAAFTPKPWRSTPSHREEASQGRRPTQGSTNAPSSTYWKATKPSGPSRRHRGGRRAAIYCMASVEVAPPIGRRRPPPEEERKINPEKWANRQPIYARPHTAMGASLKALSTSRFEINTGATGYRLLQYNRRLSTFWRRGITKEGWLSLKTLIHRHTRVRNVARLDHIRVGNISLGNKGQLRLHEVTSGKLRRSGKQEQPTFRKITPQFAGGCRMIVVDASIRLLPHPGGRLVAMWLHPMGGHMHGVAENIALRNILENSQPARRHGCGARVALHFAT